jgi:hypothetical protein
MRMRIRLVHSSDKESTEIGVLQIPISVLFLCKPLSVQMVYNKQGNEVLQMKN